LYIVSTVSLKLNEKNDRMIYIKYYNAAYLHSRSCGRTSRYNYLLCSVWVLSKITNRFEVMENLHEFLVIIQEQIIDIFHHSA